MTELQKTCSRCHQAKPLGAFKSDSRKPDGKASSCKACNMGVGFVARARNDQASGLSPLALYEDACRALDAAVLLTDVMDIKDLAEMRAAAARIAGNRQLEMQAVELRMRATRKLGQILDQQKATVGFNKGTRGQIRGKDSTGAAQIEVPDDPLPRLTDIGITHKLSSQAQRLAAVPDDEFSELIKAWHVESQTLNGRLTTDLLRVGAADRQRNARRDLAQTLSDASLEQTGTRQYTCIYFDPPWRRKQGITDRSYENHYPTMTWADIIAWATSMRPRLLPDAWGFMWIPRAHLLALHPVEYKVQAADGTIHEVDVPTPLAWAVARAMGFDAYSTCFVWTKTDEEHPDDIGSGLLVRDQDEILLMFKKGRGLPKPASNEIFGSNHRERSKPLGHSRKPQHYREMIARMVGTDLKGKPLSVLECFARHDEQFPLPENWDSIGNEAQPVASREAAE